jgi:hypothetical protein
MYEGWKKRGALSSEWVAKTDAFLDHAFARSETGTDVRCPCSKCRNIYFLDRRTMSVAEPPRYWVHMHLSLSQRPQTAMHVHQIT